MSHHNQDPELLARELGNTIKNSRYKLSLKSKIKCFSEYYVNVQMSKLLCF